MDAIGLKNREKAVAAGFKLTKGSGKFTPFISQWNFKEVVKLATWKRKEMEEHQFQLSWQTPEN